MTKVQTIDFFDLSKVCKDEKDVHTRIITVENYLERGTSYLDIQAMNDATNPIRLFSRLVERPVVNSHGELEFWVTDYSIRRGDLFEWKSFRSSPPLRARERIPRGAVLCIDTQKRLEIPRVMNHPTLFLSSAFTVYGNVRSSREAQRHVPDYQQHFIEIGAIYHAELGNTGRHGIIGNGFNEDIEAQE